MAQTPEDGDDSKLELHSLNIFRRRKTPDVDEPVAADDETPAGTGSGADEPPGVAHGTASGVVSEAPDDVAAEETQPVRTVEPQAEPHPEPVGSELGTMFPNAVRRADDDTQVLPADETEPEVHGGSGIDLFDGDESTSATPGDAEVPTARRRQRKPLSLPALSGRIAAPVTGVVVGLVGVALTYIGMQGCQLVRGTTNCGSVGLFLLIAIMALMVLLGATLLSAWRISDPLSSSFLAVGLVGVLAMLFFLPYIDRWYMVIVVPVVSALTYLLSWWVTCRFIENAGEA